MYCNKCGKQHPSNDSLCDECKVANECQVEQINQSDDCLPCQKVGNCAGIVAFLCAVVSMVGAIFSNIFAVELDITTASLFLVMAVISFFIGVLLAVRMIEQWVYACKNKVKKPVVGFVFDLLAFTALVLDLMLIIIALIQVVSY